MPLPPGPGPGRPKGSRNKLETDFLETLYANWQQNGSKAIQELRERDVAAYIKVVAGLLPKESKVDLALRSAETISEEHARLVAEDFMESLRSSEGSVSAQPGGVHDGIQARLPGRTVTP